MAESQDKNETLDVPVGPPIDPQTERVGRQPARQPRLVALKMVTIEGHWHLREPSWRFYAEVLGLGEPMIFVEPAGTFLLIFRNDGPDLVVRFTTHPEIWPNQPKAVIELPDLSAARRRLEDEMIEHQVLTGWTWPDLRIGLWDPSGNRLEIKQLWRI